ncbi:hypothetical protein FJY93_00065 [Candidatus Kaiserbacteria bacterium]|nr:hypothetical protein [Candidatus Kaiserbacteria bacterium]
MSTNDIAQKVPREAIINTFGGLMAVSPEIYRRLLEATASTYGVDVEELRPYVQEVLESLPQILD